MRIKRKEPGLASAFKQQIYDILSWYFTCVVTLSWHYAIGIFCMKSAVSTERKGTFTSTRKVKKKKKKIQPFHHHPTHFYGRSKMNLTSTENNDGYKYCQIAVI